MSIRNWFKRTKDEVLDDAEEVFDGVKSNLNLIMGVLGSVLIQSIFSILRLQEIIQITRWTLFGMVLELIAGPFIMLFVFKLVSVKRDKRTKTLRKSYKTCTEGLRKANRDKDSVISQQKLEKQSECSKHEMDIAKLEYKKDIQIAQLNVQLDTKDSKIELLETKIALLKR